MDEETGEDRKRREAPAAFAALRDVGARAKGKTLEQIAADIRQEMARRNLTAWPEEHVLDVARAAYAGSGSSLRRLFNYLRYADSFRGPC